MRALIFALLLTLVVGCATNVRDPRMTGVFRSQSGEAVMITPDQRAYVSYHSTRPEDMWWLGFIRVDPKTPREAFLLTPSACPWVGSTFVFESDYKSFSLYPYERQLGNPAAAQKRFDRAF